MNFLIMIPTICLCRHYDHVEVHDELLDKETLAKVNFNLLINVM